VKVESKASPKRTLTGLAALEDTTFTRWATGQQTYEVPEWLHYKTASDSRYEIEIRNSGTSFVVGRLTYFPTWRAVARLENGSSRALTVNQTDLTFIGMEVPKGTRQISVFYTSRVTKKIISLWLLLMVPLTLVLALSATRELAVCVFLDRSMTVE
jgi:hypothetical protein